MIEAAAKKGTTDRVYFGYTRTPVLHELRREDHGNQVVVTYSKSLVPVVTHCAIRRLTTAQAKKLQTMRINGTLSAVTKKNGGAGIGVIVGGASVACPKKVYGKTVNFRYEEGRRVALRLALEEAKMTVPAKDRGQYVASVMAAYEGRFEKDRETKRKAAEAYVSELKKNAASRVVGKVTVTKNDENRVVVKLGARA